MLNYFILIAWNMLCRERIRQRLALYQGVQPIYMLFSDDAEETFSRAINCLLVLHYVGILLIYQQYTLFLNLIVVDETGWGIFEEGRTCYSCSEWDTFNLAK